MFVIFWRGKGYVVLFAGLIAFMLGQAIVYYAKLQQPMSSITYVATQALAGLGLWFFVQRLESAPARVLIVKATGREIRVKRTAGSLFFIPTRYWPYILPALAAAVVVFQMLNRNR